ncbi:MAG: hypothetical protein KDB64_09950, partial [Solirubrobacterales bacterium]|nr:hypothetical protein [Solirubrobacterales bacterium]
GTILILRNKANIESELNGIVPTSEAHRIADQVSSAGSGGMSGSGGSSGSEKIYHAIQDAFAQSSKTVFLCMAGVMAVCFLVALIGSPSGKMEEVFADEEEAPGAEAATGPRPGSPDPAEPAPD